MPKIKTRNLKSWSVKSLNRAEAMTHRMKRLKAKSKEYSDGIVISDRDASPSGSASDQMMVMAKDSTRAGIRGAKETARRGIKNNNRADSTTFNGSIPQKSKKVKYGEYGATRKNVGNRGSLEQPQGKGLATKNAEIRTNSPKFAIDGKPRIKEKISSRDVKILQRGPIKVKYVSSGVDMASVKTEKVVTSPILMNRKSHEAKSFAKARAVKKQQENILRTKKAGEKAARGAKKAAEGIYKGARAAAVGTKALIAAIISGGAASVAIILIIVMFGAAFHFFGDSSSSNYTPVSAEVEAYSPLIAKYARVHGIPEYTELIKAVMMQESGGRGSDPMQCAESGYNTKYPNVPNGITDPEYSIDIGVKTLAATLKAAGVENPIDMDKIRLALQGYNYGNGYISWAIARDGGYTVENASVFSDEQAAKLGWSGYGDKQYPAHVLRYYPYGMYNYGIGNTLIVNVAAEQIGNPGGQKFWSWYGFNGRVEWCCIFVSWCGDQCGYLDSGTLPRFTFVGEGIDWFKARNQWQDRGAYTPRPGDVIFFDWDADGTQDHVGFVEKTDGTYVYTIEGNTSDMCARRQYSMASAEIIGYGVPRY